MITDKMRWTFLLVALSIGAALVLSACGGAATPAAAPAPTAAPKAAEPTAAQPAGASALPAGAAEAVTKAISAAKANNMADAKKSVQDALAKVTDPAQKNALNEVVDDIDKGKNDEVVEDLEILMAGGAPGREQMETALAAAKKGDWDTTKSEVAEAAGIITDPAVKNGLNEILDDIAKGKNDEVVADLEKLLK